MISLSGLRQGPGPAEWLPGVGFCQALIRFKSASCISSLCGWQLPEYFPLEHAPGQASALTASAHAVWPQSSSLWNPGGCWASGLGLGAHSGLAPSTSPWALLRGLQPPQQPAVANHRFIQAFSAHGNGKKTRREASLRLYGTPDLALSQGPLGCWQ